MQPWDEEIFSEEPVIDFLDELADLDDDDIVAAITDACLAVQEDPHVSDDDILVGHAAATIAAIWGGAPYTAGEVVEDYPFIRTLAGEGDDDLYVVALKILESLDVEADLDPFLEALAGADVEIASDNDDD